MNPDTVFAVVTAPKRNSLHWVPGTVTWSELLGWAESPANRKECGNYLLGTLTETTVLHNPTDTATCTDLHRNKRAVVSRSAITLDVDHATATFLLDFELTWENAALAHTTWKSTREEPRYRLILPTDREMLPDEYIAAAEHLMTQIGRDQFDPTSSQAERYMFRPSSQSAENYASLALDGPPLVVDDLLAEFDDDLSTKPMPKAHRNKRDPFSIEGVVGLFNQVYADWDLLIEEYELPYEKVDEDRYHLIGSRSQAGMGPINGTVGLVYSHHANDPAAGKTCSAFDLVRIHRFGDLDEGTKDGTPVNKLPSHQKMLELADEDERVRTLRAAGAKADFDGPIPDGALDDLLDDSNAWKIGLRHVPKTNSIVDHGSNWALIAENDPVLKTIRYNELTMSPEATTHLPWRRVTHLNRTITTADRYEIIWYIEAEYGHRMTRVLLDMILDPYSVRRSMNPVRDYLDALSWDGKPRVETCLPGVRPTPETRLIARKVLTAAVARMFEPGCKWDHTLVLYGDEGLGKTWWIDKMSRGHVASLTDITNKDTLLILQRSWIVVADEGHSLKKADHDMQKEFLTRTSDVFRLPYERETLVHPRHCVIWSTTNDKTFLRRQQGNRRFLIVHCQDKVDFDALTDYEVDQIWAEAVHLYRSGERLYLDAEETQAMAQEREPYIEEDALAGIISEYLDTLVPDDWWQRSIEQRLEWQRDRADRFVAEGNMTIDIACTTQLWVEAMGRRVGDHRKVDLLGIGEVMDRLPGWKRAPSRRRVPGYGVQSVFIRDDEEDLL